MRALGTDLLIGYLKDLGYEDIYRAAGGPAGSSPARPPTEGPPSVQEKARGRAPSAPPAGAPTATEPPAAHSPGTPNPGASSPQTQSARALQLVEVGGEASVCTACALAEKRNQVVFGSGDPDADLMFIGEGPGANEDRQGLPFVGPAGELLNKIIQAIELEREQVYIANVVKCRPPGNRDPKPEEVAACIGFLRRQVALVEPKVIVALGRVAAQALLACSTPIGRLRGDWYEFEGVPLRITYHPAALLRNASLKRPTWEDMQRVRDRLAELG